MLWIAAPVVALVVAAANRIRIARGVEREYANRFPVDTDGVAEGAQSFTLAGTNGRALLMLHGSGDSPNTLFYLAEQLNAAGYTVRAPLLPGHGRSPRVFSTTSAAAYQRDMMRELDALHAAHKWVGIVGLSMGGAIGAALAKESPDVKLLVLLAPYFIPPPDVARAVATSWLWGAFAPYMGGRGEASVHDKAASQTSRAYGTFSRGALRALVDSARTGLEALSHVDIPILVINSEQDNRIPRDLADRALKRVRAPLEVHWVSGCGHVITIDYCKHEVATLVRDFLARHAG